MDGGGVGREACSGTPTSYLYRSHTTNNIEGFDIHSVKTEINKLPTSLRKRTIIIGGRLL